MKPRTATASTGRPNRILIALAAAWLIVSLAIGGARQVDPDAGKAPPTRATADRGAER